MLFWERQGELRVVLYAACRMSAMASRGCVPCAVPGSAHREAVRFCYAGGRSQAGRVRQGRATATAESEAARQDATMRECCMLMAHWCIGALDIVCHTFHVVRQRCPLLRPSADVLRCDSARTRACSYALVRHGGAAPHTSMRNTVHAEVSERVERGGGGWPATVASASPTSSVQSYTPHQQGE